MCFRSFRHPPFSAESCLRRATRKSSTRPPLCTLGGRQANRARVPQKLRAGGVQGVPDDAERRLKLIHLLARALLYNTKKATGPVHSPRKHETKHHQCSFGRFIPEGSRPPGRSCISLPADEKLEKKITTMFADVKSGQKHPTTLHLKVEQLLSLKATCKRVAATSDQRNA